ncbi:LacI family DNA-binding transcriptional regulator [Spelaeicoccus albus]|uniref:DNA-binding LacI/PurR family transcriptional regulator n=1 Tax=Spelaeicoccus albus TaxID=1280376 RepID=A0A7Z0AB71_9MICO|nr:LacI family DNA-binding transcriptional regulator [Spelaeicoccus albus]NYI65961.1 DNA-binding LacI/PurR family transcriptional regulator [Spelaeicoccus albus]
MPLHLKDVAARAGVSTATASRVLRAVPGVSDKARNAVWAAVDVLGYRRPSDRERLRPVGVVTLQRPSALLDATGDVRARLISRFAADGLATAVLPVAADDGPDAEARAIDALLRAGASALVIMTGRELSTADAAVRAYRRAAGEGIPVAVIGASRHAGEPAVPEWQRSLTRMGVDEAAAMDAGVKHLVSIGHRRIALTLPEQADKSGAAQGFRRSMAARLHIVGSRADAPVVVAADTVESGTQTAGELVDSGSTAIIAGSPALTLGALAAARRRGLGVPERLSVVGYCDVPGGESLDPPLTVVRVPAGAMADAAAGEVLRAVRARPEPPGRIAMAAPDLTFQGELVVRSSTSRPIRR